mmetsp:Transcript_62567/g.146795  ORF Transcript_62567/g.146795 Transcript_62567/m.146795 type:complete len:117 (+) Transcript_62567:743-1093(+)
MKNRSSFACLSISSRCAIRIEFTAAPIDPRKEEKQAIARRMTQMAKKRSQALAGAIGFVDGVNWHKLQCMAATYASTTFVESMCFAAIQLPSSEVQDPTPYQKQAMMWFTESINMR